MRVLIADDHRDAADSLAVLCRLWGHEVVVAYDGLSALETAEAFRPHLAILDVDMPKVHGAEVAHRLRQRVDLSGIVIVATTATEPDDVRLIGYEGVFNVVLGKPYKLPQLETLLAERAAHVDRRKEDWEGGAT